MQTCVHEFIYSSSVIGIADRKKATVSSPQKIIFSVIEPPPNHSALLKGIPNEPLRLSLNQQVLFGRGHAVGVFLNDETASREHMTLFLQTNSATGENVFVVNNVSNTKPVYINGKLLHKQAGLSVLQTNDRLNIGQLEFIVTVIPGDSMEFYQVEFTKRSRINPQHPNLHQVNTPPQAQARGGINSEQIIIANQLGAVILPNNFGVPMNPAFNMNISTSGGVSQLGPTVAPFHGIPAAPTLQRTPVNAGIGQSFFQQQPMHQRFQGIPPCFQPQESAYPGMYTSPQHRQEHASAEDRRQQFHAKQPSEHNEDPKETGLDGDSHVSVQETGLQKN